MDVQTDYTVSKSEKNEVAIPNVIGKSIKEAKSLLSSFESKPFYFD